MESSMFFGNTCQNGLMPALLRPTLPAVQTSLGMKQFLPFPLDTASAVRLLPGFNTNESNINESYYTTIALRRLRLKEKEAFRRELDARRRGRIPRRR